MGRGNKPKRRSGWLYRTRTAAEIAVVVLPATKAIATGTMTAKGALAFGSEVAMLHKKYGPG